MIKFHTKIYGRFQVNVNPFCEVIIRPITLEIEENIKEGISDEWGHTYYSSLKPHGLVIDSCLTIEDEEDQLNFLRALKYATAMMLEMLGGNE